MASEGVCSTLKVVVPTMDYAGSFERLNDYRGAPRWRWRKLVGVGGAAHAGTNSTSIHTAVMRTSTHDMITQDECCSQALASSLQCQPPPLPPEAPRPHAFHAHLRH